MIGLGAGTVIASTVLMATEHGNQSRTTNDADSVLVDGALALLFGSALFQTGRFDELSSYFARERSAGLPANRILTEVGQAWERMARSAQRRRHVAGWIGIVGGAVASAISVAAWIDAAQTSTSSPDETPFIGFTVLGAAFAGMGAYLVTSDAPTQSALRAYQSAAGDRAEPTGQMSIALPMLAPLPGGGMVRLGARFRASLPSAAGRIAWPSAEEKSGCNDLLTHLPLRDGKGIEKRAIDGRRGALM
jgi:hypothetical protein